MKNLRKRIADSPAFNCWLEDRLAGYLRYAHRNSRWVRTGFEAMDAAVADGEPTIMVLWHQRLIMAPFLFPLALGPVSSLTSSARAGRLAGQVLCRFGFDTVPMSSHKRHISLSREVLRRMAAGSSIGIAADGPRGPARVASTVPLIWARSSGKRVFLVSFSARRVITLPTWDRMMLPVPHSSGVLMCREWVQPVPRRAGAAQTETLRADLEAALNAITEASDRAAGRDPAPPPPPGVSDMGKRGNRA